MRRAGPLRGGLQRGRHDRGVIQLQGAPGPLLILKACHPARGTLSHYRPAAHLLREQQLLIPNIDKDTLQRYETLFKRLNGLLG